MSVVERVFVNSIPEWARVFNEITEEFRVRVCRDEVAGIDNGDSVRDCHWGQDHALA